MQEKVQTKIHLWIFFIDLWTKVTPLWLHLHTKKKEKEAEEKPQDLSETEQNTDNEDFNVPPMDL